MKLTLYYAPIACSLVPYIALTEAGAAFDVVNVNLHKGQQRSPEYLKLNPKNKVPVLVIDGEPLTENVAILTWIGRAFPDTKLLPTEPMQELKLIAFLTWCAASFHPMMAPLLFPKMFCDLPGSEDNVRQHAEKRFLDNFRIAEELLGDQDWFFETFTLADIYYFWCFRRALQFKLDMSKFPKGQAHHERMKARPSVQKVLAYEVEVQAEFAKAA